MCNNRISIDCILLFSNYIPTILYYVSCVARVFTKYWTSFKLRKHDFMKSRVEYVNHNITANGNWPAVSRFHLLQSSSLPPRGISLLSFIGLCCFYNWYWPWFKTNIKPLRKLQRHYHRNDILIMEWTASTIRQFQYCKSNLITFPLLIRYKNYKTTFIKTD